MPDIVTEQQQQKDGEEEKKEAPASKSVVGIIYPPPEVRNIVDKTADFVARNGPEFEGRIRLNEAGNPKFNFLSVGDPYHAYYQHKINEIREGVALEASQQKTAPVTKQQPVVTMVTEPEMPKEPPPEWEFMIDPPSISRRHLDIIKLTAQFVARNGAQFMDQLMMREQKNETFDFLRKNHILFTYFTKIVEQYSKILMPTHALTANLRDTLENPQKMLERVELRVAWQKYRDRERAKAEALAEKERVQYAQIDWHDFVICETINFREDEAGYLPPPIQPSQLANRLLQQHKFDKIQDEIGEVEEIEMEVEETEMETEQVEEETTTSVSITPTPLVPALPTSGGNLQIRRDYNPKVQSTPPVSAPVSQQYLISPITGERVPSDKLEEHMKHALLDRRWAEDKRRQIDEKQNEDIVFAEGVQIATNITKLAKKRTDIFGVEETMIGQEIGEERRRTPTVQWDGHASSAELMKQQAQSKVTVQEQLEHIQRVHGLLSDPSLEKIGPKVPLSTGYGIRPPIPSKPAPIQPPPPPLPPSNPQPLLRPRPPPPPMNVPSNMIQLQNIPRSLLPTPGMPNFMPTTNFLPPGLTNPNFIHPAPPVEPPAAKKPRSEDTLIPEQEFIANHQGPVTFRIQVPNMLDRNEWSLKGQVISITLPITDPVSVIKAKMNDELNMPTGKQKLQLGPMFIKDSNSLGFYNFTSDTVVLLGLKERGGRKR